jgi:hypothetical protein
LSDNDFNRVFSTFAPTPRATFAERVGKTEPLPVPANDMALDTCTYKAFGFLPAGNIGETCDVQKWVDGTNEPEGIEFQYRFLLRLGYRGEEEIRLYLPDCIVVIEGRHLRELRKKLARRQVTFIQQYSKIIWPLPMPAIDALIQSISLVFPNA